LREHDLRSFLRCVYDDPDALAACVASLQKSDVFSIFDLGAHLVWVEQTGTKGLEEISAKWEEVFGGEEWKAEKAKHLGCFEAFCYFDDDHNGSIDLAELSEGMIRFGQDFSLSEVKEILNSLDGGPGQEKDGCISFVEFCRAFRATTLSSGVVKEGLRQLYNSYDRDRNGSLDHNEMTKLLRKMHVEGTEAEELIKKTDTNNDGLISFDELYSMLQSAQNEGRGIWTLLRLGLSFSAKFSASPKNIEAIEELKAKAAEEGRTLKIVSFIRHGQSEANHLCDIQGNAKGCWDPHITELGVSQAKKRAEELAKTPELYDFELIVVSPMTRTLETCVNALVDYIGKVPIIAQPLVAEQLTECDDIGKPPKVIKELWSEYPIDFGLLPDKPEVWWYPGPKAVISNPENETMESQQKVYLSEEGEWEEPWELVLERAHKFENWLRERTEQHICVVSHGGFIEALVGTTLGNAEQAILEIN